MLGNFIKLTIRNFYRNLTYSIVNLLGLSIGLAAFILLSLFIKFETSYDSFHKDHERIHRVEQMVTMANEMSSWSQTPAALSNLLQERYPEVEEAITIREVWGEYLSTSKERTFYEEDGFYANPDIFDLFKIDFISGSKESALDAPLKIVLTASVAKKLFPNSDPMGQSILVDSKRTYYVSGVIEDVPFNTSTKFTYIIPFSTYKSVYKQNIFNYWDWHDSKTFIKLRKGVTKADFDTKIANLLDEFIENRTDKVYIKPITMIHLRENSGDGYWIAILLYGMVGIFTLLLTAVNFVNLNTAYSLTRAKEIGIKKVVGSSRMQLFREFLGESLIFVFISLLLAFTITEAALPLFNRIVSVPLEMHYLKDWSFTVFVVCITILTGILSGLYPALILSSLNPLLTIKNQIFKSNRLKRFSMKKGLVIFQLALSVVFVLTTLGFLDQFKYLNNRNLGFEKKNLMISSIMETEKVKINDFSTLRNELVKIPEVIEASISYNSPFNGSWGRTVNWEGCQAGEKMNCRFNSAYETFLNTMKINLLAGRNFNRDLASDSTTCIVNETFINVIGWNKEEAIGKRVWNNNYTIIGVMGDFHENTPTAKIDPYILINHLGDLTGYKTLLFKLEENFSQETRGRIKTLLEEYFPDSNFELMDYDQSISQESFLIYKGIIKTFGFFSFISIVIAVIGLFALVSFSSKRKVKEIGIRKVLGAKASQLFMKLAKEYFKLIVIANLVAIPFGIFIGDVDPSYYKPEPSYSMFVWVSLSSIIVTIGTISIQIIKVSRTNPIKSLRYE